MSFMVCFAVVVDQRVSDQGNFVFRFVIYLQIVMMEIYRVVCVNCYTDGRQLFFKWMLQLSIL